MKKQELLSHFDKQFGQAVADNRVVNLTQAKQYGIDWFSHALKDEYAERDALKTVFNEEFDARAAIAAERDALQKENEQLNTLAVSACEALQIIVNTYDRTTAEIQQQPGYTDPPNFRRARRVLMDFDKFMKNDSK